MCDQYQTIRHQSAISGLNASMTLKLGSRLKSLTICTTEAIWPVLYQLQALTYLALRVVAGDGNSTAQLAVALPVDRQMARLASLDLLDCTSSVSSLLVGTSLPQLISLALDRCTMPGGITIPNTSSVPRLEQLFINSCHDVSKPRCASKLLCS